MNPLTNVKNLTKLNERELSMGIAGHAEKSWHRKYKDSAWIYVGGLPYELTEGDVICVFSQYGEVVNINLVRDHKTGKSKGFAFLCYEDQRSTVLAVDNFNGIKIRQRIIRVDHVEDYKVPKLKKDMDEDRRKIIEEGCAPTPIEVKADDNLTSTEKDEYKKKKKKKEKKQEKKKKHRKRSLSPESSKSSDPKKKRSKKDIKKESLLTLADQEIPEASSRPAPTLEEVLEQQEKEAEKMAESQQKPVNAGFEESYATAQKHVDFKLLEILKKGKEAQKAAERERMRLKAKHEGDAPDWWLFNKETYVPNRYGS